MDRLAFDVIRQLRHNDQTDLRWEEHTKKYGCLLQGRCNRPTCQCPLWESVLELTRIVLKTLPRPGEAEPVQGPGLQQIGSQTESEEVEISSSSAKKS